MTHVPSLISANQYVPKRNYTAHRHYYESIANNFYKKGLIVPVLERFPFQPDLKNKPELRADYKITNSQKGAVFFLAEALQNYNEYIKLVKEKSLRTSLARRYQFRSDLEDYLDKRYEEDKLEQYKRIMHARFEAITEKNIASREKFFQLVGLSYRRYVEFRKKRNKAYDERISEMREHFWKMVDKLSEKVPKEIPMSGASLQAILSGLAFTSEQATLLRVLSEVAKNRLKLNSAQIISHLSGNSVPEELISAMTTRFHRPKFEKGERRHVKDTLLETHVEDRKKFIDGLLQKYMELKYKRLKDLDGRIEQYWQIVMSSLNDIDQYEHDKRNLKIAGTKSGIRHANRSGWSAFNSDYLTVSKTNTNLDKLSVDKLSKMYDNQKKMEAIHPELVQRAHHKDLFYFKKKPEKSFVEDSTPQTNVNHSNLDSNGLNEEGNSSEEDTIFHTKMLIHSFENKIGYQTNFTYGRIWDPIYIKGELEYDHQSNTYEVRSVKNNLHSQFGAKMNSQLDIAILPSMPKLIEENLSRFPEEWKFEFREMDGVFTSKTSSSLPKINDTHEGKRSEQNQQRQKSEKIANELNIDYVSAGNDSQEYLMQLEKTFENALDKVSTTSLLSYQLTKKLLQRTELSQVWAPLLIKSEKDPSKK